MLIQPCQEAASKSSAPIHATFLTANSMHRRSRPNRLTASGLLILCLATAGLWPATGGSALLPGPGLAYAAESAVSVDTGLPARSQQEIAKLWSRLAPTWEQAGEPFESEPSVASPHQAGSLKTSYIESGVARTNLYRYIAGFPADVTASAEYNRLAQHGAVLNAAIGKLAHTPANPPGMAKSFYDEGYKGTSSSNLAAFTDNLSEGNKLVTSVDMYMNDSDASNIEILGHRRWILDPSLGQTGFGLSRGKLSGRYEGWYSAMYVFDDSRTSKPSYNFTSFPSVGAMPTELFGADYAWSVLLNPSRFEKPNTSAVRVTLTDRTGGAAWTFTSGRDSDPNGSKYYGIDTGGYGSSYAIVFRPDGITGYAPGDRYEVRIEGLRLKDGSAATISYETSYFSVKQAIAAEGQTKTGWPDTAGHWAEESIVWAKAAGLVDGYADNTFGPDRNLTEAEFLAIFMRAFHRAQLAEMSAKMPDADWTEPMYKLANELGYPIPGLKDSATVHKPIRRVTVAETIAWADGKNLRGDAAVQYLLDEGYSQGKTSATIEGYEPQSLLTRAEGVQFIRNLTQAWISGGE